MKEHNNFNFCNNCGKYGHLYHQCKSPITSIGVITYTIDNGVIKYLMIRRKDTIGFVDFMRGRYPLNNVNYIKSIINLMTETEKTLLKTEKFEVLWKKLWGELIGIQYRGEEKTSCEKFNLLRKGVYIDEKLITLESLIDESESNWSTPEWGFPKGRRNYQEKDLACAVREYTEETGYTDSDINIINNIIPFEEIFTGTNYKSYKHKYYLAYMNNANRKNNSKFDININSEISSIKWFTLDECIKHIRPYNLEKIELIKKINYIINNNIIY